MRLYLRRCLSVTASAQITVFIAGDSTAANKTADRRPETGWGEMLQQHFDPAKVKVDNRALNGRSTKSFIAEGKWTALIDSVKKGDFVFIQFGHNDQSKDKGERYTPPEDFKKNLIKFVDEVRAKGANPVLMTPVMRRRFDKDGKFYDTHGDYPGYTRAVAARTKGPAHRYAKKERSRDRKIRRRGFEEIVPATELQARTPIIQKASRTTRIFHRSEPKKWLTWLLKVSGSKTETEEIY